VSDIGSDEDRALLGRYADATSPTEAEVEHALTRTLARIESNERQPRLPDVRHRFVWLAAAGLATLVIATAAYAGVRWFRARSSSSEPSYGAASFDRVDTDTDAIATRPTPGPASVAPVRQVPEHVTEAAAQLEPVDAEPVATEPPASKPRQRERAKKREDPSAEPVAPPVADASVLAEESRLLAHVRRALHDDDFEGALEWAEEHARRHPHGVLTEERLVLEAVAACRGGQRERGLATAKQLRDRFPNTPTLAKVEQACGAG
jgi:hypothetical protein